MNLIDRSTITDPELVEILECESHHNHGICENVNGTLLWVENEQVVNLLKTISLNDLCPFLYSLGFDKNSEVYRKLYRDMGYSLGGYWEVFYWEMNNPDADQYPLKRHTYSAEYDNLYDINNFICGKIRI
jgi:hypothetical protein